MAVPKESRDNSNNNRYLRCNPKTTGAPVGGGVVNGGLQKFILGRECQASESVG